MAGNRELTQDSIWGHYKGKHIAIIQSIAKHTETSETLVVYKCYDTSNHEYCGTFARPMDVFLGKAGGNRYRFNKIYNGIH